ncbi:MAG: PAS domain-containing sensor histidine kinase [Methanobacteriota archaeon]
MRDPDPGPAVGRAPPYAEALAGTALDALYALSPDGTILSWNWGAETLYGIPASEAVGDSVYRLLVPAGDIEEMRRALTEAVETDSSVQEMRRVARSGAPLVVQTVIRAVRPGTGGVQFLAVCEKDMTDAKHLEKQLSDQIWSLTAIQGFLQGILDGSQDYAIIATDAEGRVQVWNECARLLFGYAQEDVKGRSCVAFLCAPEEVTSGRAAEAFRSASSCGRFAGELLGVRRDGARFPLGLTVNRLRATEREDPGFVVIARDLTDAKRAEEERLTVAAHEREIARLKELDELKTSIINTASHELSTPLTPITLQLHLLKRSAAGIPPELQKSVTIIDRNVERLASLVSEVLEVARIQAGRLPVEPAPIRVAEALTEACESYEDPAEAAGVSLRLSVPPDDVVAFADRVRLGQVLSNLLANAIKFTPKGGHVVAGAVRRDGRVLLYVEDDGVGIDAADLPKLFQPFSQVHDPLERTRSGSGLGLYICRGIVEAHGGRISCESAGRGKGSRFSVELPTG